MNRREALKLAVALGASLAWKPRFPHFSFPSWPERRDLFPQGVASGDPYPDSVLIWTRRPPVAGDDASRLTAQVAEDVAFHNIVAESIVPLSADSDWTCRVLAAGLKPRREYWYRFVDDHGNASRVGRTLTAPAPNDNKPLNFAFVSCQNVQQGSCNAYRRMIWEDARRPIEDRLSFVLHLGDFVYEVVQYPDQVKNGHRYDRRIRFPVHFPTGKTVAHDRFWVPASLEDYRALYHAYLEDPDLQDARARWPFVAVWDNHEFSWLGWQAIQEFGEGSIPAQTLKVAANQAWFEYQPARVAAAGARLDSFVAPHVVDTPVTAFDDDGLGREANNLAAIDSLIVYRALRWGRHIDLILTDQHSFRSRDPGAREELTPLFEGDALGWVPEELAMQLDAGRDYAGGHPPATLSFRGKRVANVRAGEPAQTFLGAKQKAWFLDRLRSAQATWKIWGNSLGTPDWRVDPQHLPPALGSWTGEGFAVMGTSDWGGAYHERAEIFDAVRDAGITGFAIVSGDRHSFWAGYAAKALPPAAFEPVGVTFVGGSLISPGMLEASEHNLKKDDPLRPLYVANPGDGPTQPTVNLLLHHGVRSALEYAKSGDLKKAHAASNPHLAPHLTFVDMGGHGYATVRVDAGTMVTEFVCIPRPIERSPREDGGPLRYRVRHEVSLWQAGERPRLRQTVVEGDPGLAV